jgi:branched-chain amino acid aminotransferase
LKTQETQIRYIALNGRTIPEQEARISPLDRGFLYGDGLFETIKARKGRIDFLAPHLKRLKEGARTLRIPFPDRVDFEEIILDLLERNGIQGEAAVKICLSRGIRSDLPLSTRLPHECDLRETLSGGRPDNLEQRDQPDG